ncbi:hypothetical protein CEUSTIGMA_g5917.t1 [Chlamydomonas eustigma]|uniref:Phosphoglycerate mutase (2,3-diphosphoglycerate-dependent) n=1 Tax=Chlamydomonas eustigma TaxID=1157962 RepID=A0A250X5Z3_9CHLO|nr:hypothetical protein CEUSTIGMA_g5917.t1 [Chlamydomonas eustigma]|eukprot:GAX78478.1 hypothetical protein CEUSTIGMA_g5917.t1 [Chlamydomonas eustigma]
MHTSITCFPTDLQLFTSQRKIRRLFQNNSVAAERTANRPWIWTGSDEYTPLNDRTDAPPLLLPTILTETRVAIVRHGQSTWNAESRVQGSSDLSVLTEKGRAQAEATRAMLQKETFDRIYASPLARARETADIILKGGSHSGTPRYNLPVLREIDLYSFQGLLKTEVKQMFPAQYRNWQLHPERFELEGHAPVREMWHRGSLAWRSILTQEIQEATSASASSSTSSSIPPATTTGVLSSAASSAGLHNGHSSSSSSDMHSSLPPSWPHSISSTPASQGSVEEKPRSLLVVAHNNTNQALIATALCLPCTHFRRLLQNNAAVSHLLLKPSPWKGASPEVVLEALNQSPSGLFKQDEKIIARVVLVAAEGAEDDAQRAAVASVVAETQVYALLTGPHSSSQIMAEAILKGQGNAANNCFPQSFNMQPPSIGPAYYPAQVWTDIKALSLKAGPGSSIAVIGDSFTLSAILCLSLELGLHRVSSFKISPASLTLLEFHSQQSLPSHAVVRCVNNTAHLNK